MLEGRSLVFLFLCLCCGSDGDGDCGCGGCDVRCRLRRGGKWEKGRGNENQYREVEEMVKRRERKKSRKMNAKKDKEVSKTQI